MRKLIKLIKQNKDMDFNFSYREEDKLCITCSLGVAFKMKRLVDLQFIDTAKIDILSEELESMVDKIKSNYEKTNT